MNSEWSAPNREGGLPHGGHGIEIQLVLISRDLTDLRTALYGDGRDRKGLIVQVEELSDVADRGRTSLKVLLWLGGSMVAGLTALAQFKTVFISLREWSGL